MCTCGMFGVTWLKMGMPMVLLGWLSLCVAVPLQHVPSPELASRWDVLTAELERWAFTVNFGVHVGTPDHEYAYLHLHGNMTMDTPIVMASSSKWPSATMIMGLVADGTIASLDDHPQKYISWWSSDPADPRSHVTLRHLLSFTSGFEEFAPYTNNTACFAKSDDDYMRCAAEVFASTKLAAEPGTLFAYNSLHLQFAGAMAVAASGKPITELLDKYLLGRLGMTNSTCTPNLTTNPILAVCLVATGRDYSKFLHSLLTYNIFPKEFVDEMERDYTPGDVMARYAGYGHYCMGHFYECFFNNAGFTDSCRHANVHADPGAFGFYPLIDRTNNYLLQIVVMESGDYYPRSGIPEYLRLAVTPYVIPILEGKDPQKDTAREELVALTLDDINYITDSMKLTSAEAQSLPTNTYSRGPRFRTT